MSSHPIGSGSPTPPWEWQPVETVSARAQTRAALRAAAVVVVLLVILALMVWI